MMGMRRRHHAMVVSLLPLILASTLAAEAPLAEDADLYAHAPQVVDLGPAAFQGDAAALAARFPALPLCNESDLQDPSILTAFAVRLFCHHQWRHIRQGPGAGRRGPAEDVRRGADGGPD